MGQFSMEKPALKGQFSVEINTVVLWPVMDITSAVVRPRSKSRLVASWRRS